MRRIALLLAIAVPALLAGCDNGPSAGRAPTAAPAPQTALPAAAGATGAGTPVATPAPVARTIAEARRLPVGSAVSARGAVTAAPGVFDGRGRKFYLQDDSGGIAVFFAGGGLRLAEGDGVSVTGTLAAFNSELEIVLSAADGVKRTGSHDAIQPAAVKTSDITEQEYGRLVTVSGGVHAVKGEAFWMDDGSGGIQVQVIPAGLTTRPRPGDAVTVTGISARSKGTFQVLPRHAGEIAITGRWTDPEQAPPPLPRPLSTRPEAASVKIVAFYPHTYEDRAGEAAEMVRLQNLGSTPVDLSGWQLTDNAEVAVFPPGAVLQAGARWTITRSPERLDVEFGGTSRDKANFMYAAGPLRVQPGGPRTTAALIPNFGSIPAGTFLPYPAYPAPMLGGRLRFANLGGEAALLDPGGAVADAVVYGLGNTDQPGWTGPAVQPYLFDYFVWPAGQVLYRKLDQITGRPLADTDTAADWAQDPDDPVNGRRLLYAGWTLDEFFFPAAGTEQATTQFLLAPDNLYEGVAALIDSARTSIDIEVYTFSSPHLLQRIVARQQAGVKVRVLFDGGVFNSPDGSYDEDRWVAQEIVRHGGQAWFWRDDPATRMRGRYNNRHQKFMIVDDVRVLITSENFEQTSMPADDKANGTAGNRGAGVITDASAVVRRLREVFAADADPGRRTDIHPVAMDRASRPPQDRGDLAGYTVNQPAPLTVTGPLTFEVVQSPESSLRTVDALIGMVERAGAGDAVLVQQQYEHATWNGGVLNPRLAAYIAAARRGATVLLLLDAVNDSGPNERTQAYARELAQREGLRLEVRLGKPAGGPIHNKMVLVTSGADAHVHISSINGSENSSIFNREVGIQVRSPEAYRYFARAFAADWRASGGALPVDTRGPP